MRAMTAGFMSALAWPSMPLLPALRSYAPTIASTAVASRSGVLHLQPRVLNHNLRKDVIAPAVAFPVTIPYRQQ